MSSDHGSGLGVSRRSFLQQIGLGTGALGLGMALVDGAVRPGRALAICETPGNPGTAKPWLRDCRPIRARRPASTLSPAEVQKIRDAYAAMRALDTSDPNDPRGFMQQANIHCHYCGHFAQVHGNWQFFAFHRAYLYFHERILGKLIDDMEFRLPYWDWDVTSHRKLPPSYTAPGDATNPLWNGTRWMSPTDELPDEDVGATVMTAALTAATFSEFGGTASFSGIPEGAPHGSVHVDVGGDMSTFDTAGRDPVFYAHHANVDKIWSDWNKASSSHTNPTDPAFLNLSWGFYDESKVWRTITAAQVLNPETQLRYVYGPSEWIERLRCLLRWIVVKTDWAQVHVLTIPPKVLPKLQKSLEAEGAQVRLQLIELAVPVDKSAVYRLYANREAAQRGEGPGSPEYLGAFPVVLSDREAGHEHKKTRTVTVPLSLNAVNLLSEGKHALAFVERTPKGGAKPLPVKARDVQLSYAETEEE